MAENEQPLKKDGPVLPESAAKKDEGIAPEMKELEKGKSSTKLLGSLTYTGTGHGAYRAPQDRDPGK